MAQPGQHGQQIAGGPAGVGLQQGVPLGTQAALGKVDEQLPQGGHVNGSFHVHSSSFRSVQARQPVQHLKP